MNFEQLYTDKSYEFVQSDFDIINSNLTSLKGAPHGVSGDCIINAKKLKSFKNSTLKTVGGVLDINAPLTTLQSTPSAKVLKLFKTKLKTLEYMPRGVEELHISNNTDLVSFKGAAETIDKIYVRNCGNVDVKSVLWLNTTDINGIDVPMYIRLIMNMMPYERRMQILEKRNGISTLITLGEMEEGIKNVQVFGSNKGT